MRGVCETAGEIDLATVPAFSVAMRAAIDDADTRDVFVDCSAITFMDSSAFHAIVAANTYARRRARQLTIRELRHNCAHLLNLCDWDRELIIEA